MIDLDEYCHRCGYHHTRAEGCWSDPVRADEDELFELLNSPRSRTVQQRYCDRCQHVHASDDVDACRLGRVKNRARCTAIRLTGWYGTWADEQRYYYTLLGLVAC